jgi:hypothetical protein
MYSSGDNDFLQGSGYEESLRWQLEQAEQFLAGKVTNCFKDKSTAAIKAIIQYDTAEVLEWLMDIAIAAEHYEICAAVQQINIERKLISSSC